jgi:hypothetical protein
MWKCRKCSEENEDSFDACWSCGTSIEGNSPTNPNEFMQVKEDILKTYDLKDSGSKSVAVDLKPNTYFSTLKIAALVSFVGWFFIVAGLGMFLLAIFQSLNSYGFSLILLYPSFGALFCGLILIILSRFTEVSVSNAINTEQILKLLKTSNLGE